MAEKMTPGNNRFDEGLLGQFHERYFNLEDEKASIMGKALNECKNLATDQRNLVQEAKDEGIPKKEFNSVIKYTKAQRKIDKEQAKQEDIRAELDPEQQDIYDEMMQSLALDGEIDAPPQAAAE